MAVLSEGSLAATPATRRMQSMNLSGISVVTEYGGLRHTSG
ncbi:uncharacterized protein FTOL_07089 [Fusarium torulosum]|uniref:Uncharacterized protein n=1 Tax=Fusarium torulosum TaxID=33205 RepID=A0AAE8SIN9_9HYPO|nr:uncharacterized protein FTOL_07089 [Fusarium torulosum]